MSGLILILLLSAAFFAIKSLLKEEVICKDCGFHASLSKTSPGNLLIEIILWLCFLIPGLIYSAWRFSSRAYQCPACSSWSIIPVATPIGQELVRKRAAVKKDVANGANVESGNIHASETSLPEFDGGWEPNAWKIGAFCLVCMFLMYRLWLPSVVDMSPGYNEKKKLESENPLRAPADDVAKMDFIKESCTKMHQLFGDESNLSSVQKEELWEKYRGKNFQWRIDVIDVSQVGGDFAVEGHCLPGKSDQDKITVYFPKEAKAAAIKFRKGKTDMIRGKLKGYSGIIGYYLVANAIDQ